MRLHHTLVDRGWASNTVACRKVLCHQLPLLLNELDLQLTG
jgi:hypothetical protein